MTINNLHVSTSAIQPVTRLEVSPVYFGGSDTPQHYHRSDILYCSMTIDNALARGFNGPILQAISAVLPDGAYIAGGAVASAMSGIDVSTDIDIFFTSSQAFIDTYNLISNPPDDNAREIFNGYTCDNKLDNIIASNLAYIKFTNINPNIKPIQLIKIVWYSDVTHIIDSFDLTTCQFALDHKSNKLWYSDIGAIDLLKRRVDINRMHANAIAMLRRIMKYQNKGYEVPTQVLVRIAEEIKNGKYVNLDLSAEQPMAY